MLVPGLIFRYAAYEGSPVRRPFFAGGTIYSSIAVLLYSIVVFIIFWFVVALGVGVINLFHNYRIPLRIVEFNGVMYIFDNSIPHPNNRRFELTNFLFSYPVHSALIFLGVATTALLSAYGVQWLSRRSRIVGRLMYGPLAPFISKIQEPVLTCFVLTKVVDGNQRLMYAELPKEISLGDGNNIDHLILEDPVKFYLRLNKQFPTTTFDKARPMSTQAFSQGHIFVRSSEIENIHFEAFYFPDEPSSLRARVAFIVAVAGFIIGGVVGILMP